MKIAQIPPLYESVPPKMYGGTERVVSYLTEELVKQGHEVTLFGTNDSITKAELFPICEQAIRLNKTVQDPLAYHIMQMMAVTEHAHEYDVLHFHNDYIHYPFSSNAGYTHLTTLHGRLDLPELKMIYKKFDTLPLVSISNDQRKPQPNANWAATVYHGLPLNLYQKGNGEGGYLAFIGRISPEKRPDRAIEIAKRTGLKLKIAAKVDMADQVYYEQIIKPMMDHPLIEFIGEIGEAEKGEFLGNAIALLFPIDWPEPFGMVMIEAMANGTPVIAFDCGSVPEVLDNNITGFIVNHIDQAVEAVNNIHRIDRNICRQVFEEKYSAAVMAYNYLAVYEKLIKQSRTYYVIKNDIVSGCLPQD